MEQLQQIPLFLRRVMSFCFVLFQINNFITLEYLLQKKDNYTFYFICLLLAQVFLFSYFKTSQSNWSIVTFCLKWNLLCYIPTVKDSISQEKQDQLVSSLMYFLKLGLIYIHSLFCIVAYVKYEEGGILSLFFASQFGFLTSTMMYELKQNYTQNHAATLRQIFTKYFFTNLLTGYASLCSELWPFYYVIILTIIFGIAISQVKNLQQIFQFGYEHDVINYNYVNASVIVFIFLSFSGVNFGFQPRSLEVITGTQQEYSNFNTGLQAIILIVMISFDLLFSQLSQNRFVRAVLLAYLLIFSHSFYLILRNILHFAKYGPYQRKIHLDCSLIGELSEEEINKQYFRFKPMQYQITAFVKNANVKTFRTIACILLKEKNRKITFQLDYENSPHRLSYTVSSIFYSNLIQIYLDETTYGAIIIEEIIRNKYFNFSYQICFFHDTTPKKQALLLNVVIQNYQIIPNILTYKKNTLVEIHCIKQPVYQIIAFNKLILQEMIFSQQQILFDLYEFF